MEDWIDVKKRLPDNGDEVVIAVKNKNKEGGIWLFDIAIFLQGFRF